MLKLKTGEYRSTGVLEYWSTGVPEYWSTRVLEYWSTGVPEYWSTGALEYRSTGVLEYWSTGVLEYWGTGVLEHCSVILLDLRNLTKHSYCSNYVTTFVTRPAIFADALLRNEGRQKGMGKYITMCWKNYISRK